MKKRNCMVSLMLLGSILVLGGCKEEANTDSQSSAVAYNQATTPHYDVVKREDKAVVDGKLDEKVWIDIPAIAGGFHFPWDVKEAPYTEFKGYNDGTDFYFSFTVKDKDVLVDEKWKEDESTVDNEDRVELFFAGGSIDKPGSEGMPKYYGVEIDPQGRVHDYSIVYYRDFDSKWNLDTLETKATKTDDGYIVEGKVSLDSLRKLKLVNEKDVMRTGVYRAEFSTPKKEGEDPVMEWISWVDPKTPAPDYHVDSSFGEFRFLK
ncbi:sugar-binding protein [Amedibacterium intestinale]|uniref:Carbohydrate-binding domain-containing protein n=1 Tax=Amedibacterium intestinale TaxID=2583452 RepID=A0A6N4TLC0_9FIRM|nr:sugar-binding protein [Amedibacterium intestinale]RHO15225.1 endoxylanase [Eubacterium sp. AM18-26]RHO21121.1 endoxylanase [Eubacterium sp. AM18-10LB-B]BBK23559.1 hypothetical protein Aargi30884_24620 [Amedibacterium intestinale]BBK63280.1 hypothetical protein A9CBEGH2_22200 [Amedibacterium intestinale]